MTIRWKCLMPEWIRVWWPWTMVSQWRVCFSILLRVSLSLQVANSIITTFIQCLKEVAHYFLIIFTQGVSCPPNFSLSLGGRYVKVWDLLKGGQPLVSLKNHHKTVTCLSLSSNGQRLLSGSLDRYGTSACTVACMTKHMTMFKCYKSQRPLLCEFDLMQNIFLSSRHVKVYNTSSYKVVHNFDYAASILSLALAVRNHI